MRALGLAAAAALASVLAVGAANGSGAEPRSPDPHAHSARQCFWVRDVNGFETHGGRTHGDPTLYLITGVHDLYRIDGFCPDVDWTARLAIKTFAGSDNVCSGDMVEVLVPQSIIGRCSVRIGPKLSKDEAYALEHSRSR